MKTLLFVWWYLGILNFFEFLLPGGVGTYDVTRGTPDWMDWIDQSVESASIYSQSEVVFVFLEVDLDAHVWLTAWITSARSLFLEYMHVFPPDEWLGFLCMAPKPTFFTTHRYWWRWAGSNTFLFFPRWGRGGRGGEVFVVRSLKGSLVRITQLTLTTTLTFFPPTFCVHLHLSFFHEYYRLIWFRFGWLWIPSGSYIFVFYALWLILGRGWGGGGGVLKYLRVVDFRVSVEQDWTRKW